LGERFPPPEHLVGATLLWLKGRPVVCRMPLDTTVLPCPSIITAGK